MVGASPAGFLPGPKHVGGFPPFFTQPSCSWASLLDACIGFQGIDVGLQLLEQIDERIVFSDDQLIGRARCTVAARWDTGTPWT